MEVRYRFLKGLQLCSLLDMYIGTPSMIPYEVIEILVSIPWNSLRFRVLLREYELEVNEAINNVRNYGSSIDNWRSDSGFGLKDQCSIISYLLSQGGIEYKAIGGNFKDGKKIEELLRDTYTKMGVM